LIAAPTNLVTPSIAPTRPRRRILVSAYAISPVRGSEPGVGWQICSRLARYHDVTVLCAPGVPGPDANYFREEISQFTAKHGDVPNLTLKYIEPPLLSFLFQRETPLARRTFYYTGYTAWQKAAYETARELHAKSAFDLVHHLNITGFREPGFLWKLDAPFVWGPIGGAPELPAGYFDLLTKKDALFYRFRNWMNRRQKVSARCLEAAKKAQHIWGISVEDARLAEETWGRPSEQMLETGATVRANAVVRDYDGTRPLRIIWNGQHFGRKALPILLHAIAKLPNQNVFELTVIGDGSTHQHWRDVANSLGLKNVKWTGRVTHEVALAEMSAADVLAFTSVLEGTPHVVLEALSLGVPVICHNACGMGVAVNDNCGLHIDMHDSQQSINAFAAALAKLQSNPGLVKTLSRGAIDRASQLSWDNKVEQIVETYEHVLATVAGGRA